VEARDLPGCFVDSETLDQAMADTQEVIAMYIDSSLEASQPLPKTIARSETLPLETVIAVAPGEYEMSNVSDDLRLVAQT
jgi:predicted RNase H-like HicB family nuclease